MKRSVFSKERLGLMQEVLKLSLCQMAGVGPAWKMLFFWSLTATTKQPLTKRLVWHWFALRIFGTVLFHGKTCGTLARKHTLTGHAAVCRSQGILFSRARLRWERRQSSLLQQNSVLGSAQCFSAV